MTILSGWREQYGRMQRSYARLQGIATGVTHTPSDSARDALVHFFQDAYHLKDWIKNDPSTGSVKPESAIDESEYLTICADLCNGSKHRGNRKGRAGGDRAELVAQGVNISPGTGTATHEWHVFYDDGKPGSYEDKKRDALMLAGDIMTAWDAWLASKGLMSADNEGP